MITEFETVKFTDYNNTETKRDVNLVYNGSVDGVTGVYVKKFTICKTFPTYIPKLVPLDKNITFSGMLQTTVDNDYLQLPYRMDLAVCVVNPTNNKYCCVNVRYETQHTSYTKPFPFNMFDADLTRSTTLNNEYFYMYSTLELTKAITKAIRKCMVACGIVFNEDDIYIVMLDNGHYQLIIKSTLIPQTQIYFNNKIKIMFPFDCVHDASNDYYKVIFDKFSETEITETNYYVAQTIYLSSRIYPFRNLVITTNSFATQAIKKNSLQDNVYNNKIVEVLSYSLNIDKPDLANDVLEYPPASKIEVLDVMTPSFQNPKLNIFMQTIDGYNVSLELKPDEFIDITLIFTK